MTTPQHPQPSPKIGMVAHDETKPKLAEWLQKHADAVAGARIFGTGTTAGVLKKACPDMDITALKNGPLGGDQQLGAMIAEGELDALFFFIDPMTPHPHDVDVKALIRLATLYDVPTACNQATADLIVSSPFFGKRG